MAFYGVYIREAHPVDGWVTGDNVEAGIRIATHQTIEERVEAASMCCGALHLNVPLLVDHIDDKVGEAYSGFPDRLYLIDRNGKIAYKGGRGPFGMQPAELEQSIILLLADEARKAKEASAKKAEEERTAREAAAKHAKEDPDAPDSDPSKSSPPESEVPETKETDPEDSGVDEPAGQNDAPPETPPAPEESAQAE